MNGYVIGIDLGASLIKYTAMGENGQPGRVDRVPTYGELGPEMVISQIHNAIDKAKASIPGGGSLLGIGIGTPGLIGNKGEIIGEAVNIPGWRDVDLRGIMAKREQTNVTVQNDVNLTALGELYYGAGKDVRNLVCISIGTGIGGGIVLDGKLYSGGYGLAAEIGHLIVEPEGLECDCGQHGCLEQYSSAIGLAANCFRLAEKFPSELADIAARHPDSITAEYIYSFLEKGDKLAMEVHHLSCRMLARAIGLIMNLLAPEMIVLCGGVMKSGDLILPDLLELLPRYSIGTIQKRCRVLPGDLGPDAGVIGAAVYALRQFAPTEENR